jgi:cyclophilin family peptidyl-prolyl cis-trans isomerase
VGTVYIDLLEDYAPLATNSFVFLAQQSFYNNTTFHRVIENFMAQGGDPTGTGMGGPGYQFADEFMSYITFSAPGLLAMANAGPGTNGSQFFITTVPTPHLNYNHTIFGRVIEGQEVVENIRLRDPASDTQPGTALQTVLIIEDPSLVDSPVLMENGEVASAEELQATFEQLLVDLPESLELEPEGSGILTTDETVLTAPPAETENYEVFLTQYEHAYRVGQTLETAACDLSAIPFIAISAQVDVFPSAANARAALGDGYLETLALARGFASAEDTPPSLTNRLYTQDTVVCDIPSTHAMTYAKRGRYLVTFEVIIPASSSFSADQWLSEFVSRQIYDSVLGEIFVREMPWTASAP